MNVKQLRDLTFECPVCKCKHNVRDWIIDCLDRGLAVFDSEYARDAYLRGIVSLRSLGLQCGCGQKYMVDIADQTMRVYRNEKMIYEEKYEGGSR